MKKEEIQLRIYSLVIPKEILLSFEIENIKENEEIVEIDLTEKEIIPYKLSGKQAVLNGYMNPIELQSYPIQKEMLFEVKTKTMENSRNNG